MNKNSMKSKKGLVSIFLVILLVSVITPNSLIEQASAAIPTISDTYPLNMDTEVGLIPRLFACVDDTDEDTLTVNWMTNRSGTWTQISTQSNIPAGTNITAMDIGMNQTSTRYWWSINVTDGTSWRNQTYSFTTQTGNFAYKWNTIYSTTTSSYSDPIAEDINGDGIYEVFYSGRDPGIGRCFIICFNGSTGEINWRYNLPSNTYLTNEYHVPLAVGDLDNDGYNDDLVTAAGRKTIALDANDASVIWIADYASGWGQVAIADTDNNGYPYVYVSSNTGFETSAATRKLYGTNGTLAAENYYTTYTCYGGVSIADMDRDGEYEILISDAGDSICYDEDLNILWTTGSYTSESHAFVLINVTGDADLEAINMYQDMSSPYAGGIYVYYANGTLVPGMYQSTITGWGAHCQPAAYDIDKDGHVELTSALGGSYSMVWDLVSWSNDFNAERSTEPPDFANVLGDSDLELCSGAAWEDATFDFYDSTYSNVAVLGANYPSDLYEYGVYFIVQDVDGDGLNEIMWSGTSNGEFTCWDTLAVAPTPSVRTDTYYYSERRQATGIYIPKIGLMCNLTNPSIADDTTGVSISTTELTVDINEPNGDVIDWWITTSPNIGSSSGTGEANGTKTCSVSGLQQSVTYTWTITATDGVNWKISNYTFTTGGIPSGYYINKTSGDDENSGDFSHPWETIQHAVNTVTAGDIVYIMDGTYYEKISFENANSGTSDNWITYRNYGNDLVFIDGTDTVLTGGIINTYNKSYIRFTGLELRNSGVYGFFSDEGGGDGGHNITIDNCTINNCSASAIIFYPYAGTYGYMEDIIIENNTIYNCMNGWNHVGEPPNEIITVSNVTRFYVRYNTMYLNYKISIDAKNDACHGEIYWNRINTTAGPEPGGYNSGIYIDGYDDDAHNISIYNNIIWGDGTAITIGTEQGGTVTDVQVYNNICEGPGHGFQMNNHTSGGYDPDSPTHKKTNIKVCNNIFISSSICFQLTDANGTLVNFFFRNNILQGPIGINIGSGQTNLTYQQVDFNLFNITSPLSNAYWGTHVINGSTGFVSQSNRDYNLTILSDAIDNGIPTYAPSVDIWGTERPQGNEVDIGATEYIVTISHDGYCWWNITIEDPDGDLTTGTITCSSGDFLWFQKENDTWSLLLENLDYGTNYTVWVNYTDGTCTNIERYWFWTIFDTEPNPPSLFYPLVVNNTVINITWTRGLNADYTYIVYKEGSNPPTDREDGTLAYNGMDETYSLSGLSSGTTYSFSAWGYNSTSSSYSFLYTTSTESTLGDISVSIRNDGLDFFVWLGTNTTAYYVATNLTGFDDSLEYIAIWNNDTWSDDDGNWVKYYGDESGTNFNIHTFDVVSIYMVDVPMSFPETQDYYMNYNPDMDYERSYTHLWLNNSVTYGYNYTGYNKVASTTLGDISTSTSLQTGEAIAIWNRSTYTWNWYLVGFWTPSVTVDRWDVILSKVSVTRTWNT